MTVVAVSSNSMTMLYTQDVTRWSVHVAVYMWQCIRISVQPELPGIVNICCEKSAEDGGLQIGRRVDV